MKLYHQLHNVYDVYEKPPSLLYVCEKSPSLLYVCTGMKRPQEQKRAGKESRMELEESLQNLKRLACQKPEVREALLATRKSESPVKDFCRLSAEYGYPVSEMDLVMAGEEYYAAMRRSTNGGGENSPLLDGEDDYYELFLSELEAE